jgi:hypothetical protein
LGQRKYLRFTPGRNERGLMSGTHHLDVKTIWRDVDKKT